jgi:DNA topoisomerase-1
LIVACALTPAFRLRLQYDEANKQVAILCNHQKGVSKSHDTSMGKLLEKKSALQAEIADAKGPAIAKLRCVAPLPRACGVVVTVMHALTWALRACVWLLRCSERLATLERMMESRESLKNVSLGTSKINYLDPRFGSPSHAALCGTAC